MARDLELNLLSVLFNKIMVSIAFNKINRTVRTCQEIMFSVATDQQRLDYFLLKFFHQDDHKTDKQNWRTFGNIVYKHLCLLPSREWILILNLLRKYGRMNYLKAQRI